MFFCIRDLIIYNEITLYVSIVHRVSNEDSEPEKYRLGDGIVLKIRYQ